MNKPFIKWLLGLWDNTSGGMSMRKFLSVWAMVLVTLLHCKYLAIQKTRDTENWDYGKYLIMADYIMIGLLIGFIVFGDVMKLYKGSPPAEEKKETEAPKGSASV